MSKTRMFYCNTLNLGLNPTLRVLSSHMGEEGKAGKWKGAEGERV